MQVVKVCIQSSEWGRNVGQVLKLPALGRMIVRDVPVARGTPRPSALALIFLSHRGTSLSVRLKRILLELTCGTVFRVRLGAVPMTITTTGSQLRRGRKRMVQSGGSTSASSMRTERKSGCHVNRTAILARIGQLSGT